MKRLLSIELQKIWKNRASKVLTISYFLLLTTIALIASIKFDFWIFHFRLADQGIFNFPFIWHFNSYVGIYAKIFLAIVIVSMMANEYSYGTLKQNLIDGMSKKEFVLSKFLTVILFSLISTFYIFILTLILGYSFSSYTEFGIVFSDLEFIFAYFIDLVAFFSFCLMIGILIKRSAFSLGFIFIWFVLEKFTFLLLKHKIFPNTNIAEKISNFFPLESISNLLVQPFSRLNFIKTIGNKAGVVMKYDYSVYFSSVLIVSIWTAIFVYLSYKIIQKRDL
jgi:ABC-type transport system involved in multi-copper enzyme maturation permease subunit